MKVKTIIPFLAITFGLTWGIAILLVFFTDQVESLFGEVSVNNPLYILAVYSPGIAATFLVWCHYGLKGLTSFFKRLTLWKMSKWWWLYLIFGIPFLAYFASFLNDTINNPFPFFPWYQVFPALLSAFFLGTIEEFGWRGLMLPLLQKKLVPFWAGLLLGVVWAIWHIPAFFLSGVPFENWSFLPLFLGLISISVILTPMFNNAKGSLLIAYLYHFQMMNPIWPEGQPWENFVFLIVAIIIVIINRQNMFKKGFGVTSILIQNNN